jgi:RNA polymerase sigma-70 factor, ECF subfamily
VLYLEKKLLQQLYVNDPIAFDVVMDTYNKFLWAIVGGILCNIGTTQDIEECIADVYVRLWENPRKYNPEKGTLKTFLAIIAKNKALDKYRQLSKIKLTELDEALHSGDDDLMEYIINKEMCNKLYEAINLLKEPDKEIMVRRYFFDERPSYIADKISLPIKEVENRLYQGKLRLKKNLISMEAMGYGS